MVDTFTPTGKLDTYEVEIVGDTGEVFTVEIESIGEPTEADIAQALNAERMKNPNSEISQIERKMRSFDAPDPTDEETFEKEFAKRHEYNHPAEFARNVANAVTFEHADEIEAGVRSAFSDETYDDIVSQLRAQQNNYRLDKPAEAIIAGIGTGFLTGTQAVKWLQKYPKIMEWAFGNSNTPLGKKLLKFSRTGGIGGAVMGEGLSEPQEGDSVLANTLTFGAGGAVIPPLLLTAGGLGKPILQGLNNARKNILGTSDATMESLDYISKQLAREGRSPQEIEDLIKEAKRLGINDVQLAELTAGNRALSKQAMNVPTRSSDDVINAITNRNQDMNDVIQDSIRKKLGIDGDDFSWDYAQRQAEKQYAKARSAYPNAYTQKIGKNNYIIKDSQGNDINILDSDLVKRAWARYQKDNAKRIMPDKNLPSHKDILAMEEIPTEILHKIKIGMDKLIEPQVRGGNRTMVAQLTQDKKLFDDITRKHNQAYAKANDEFYDASRLQEVFEKGQKFSKMGADELKDFISKLDAEKLDAFKKGVFDTLVNKAENMNVTADLSKKVFGTRKQQEMLKALFNNDEEFADFLKLMDYQKGRRSTSNLIGNQSFTQTGMVQHNIIKRGGMMDWAEKLMDKLEMPEAVAENLKKQLLNATEAEQQAILQSLKDMEKQAIKSNALKQKLKSGTLLGTLEGTKSITKSILNPTYEENNQSLGLL